jgi:acyl transferase domain-containing protein/acyl carrier protein
VSDSATAAQANGLEIAIIGMEGRFPGARTIIDFWQNLKAGVESVTYITDQELAAAGVAAELRERPDYVRLRPILDDVEFFDAPFFGYTPREAEIMDPQQRIFLECAWAALERAGYDAEQYPGAIGIYAGVNINSYLLNLYTNRAFREASDDLQALLGNDKDYLATRISYKLNLTGPSFSVQSACSTGLVAVHLACRSLLGGECDMALAGGVSISLPQHAGYQYQAGGLYSPDGHCRAFDAHAQGTSFGNGVGLVVLKRLDDALTDGDTIHAVIKGSAINNDGAQKVGYTAPSGTGQLKVISAAHAIAEIDPATIGYVEAHGTATPLGDPIEIAALTRAFRAGTQKTGFCAIGSVKTNIGHLNTAAGIAGLIKTVLMLEHQQIPPSLHFDTPNPNIDFADSPFYVNTQLAEWRAGDNRRRAGVSAFGVGGTNAHVVLEEAPAAQPTGTSRPTQLLLLSAKTAAALETATANLAAHLRQHPNLDLADAAYTLQIGRRRLSHRRMLICRDHADALAQLDAPQNISTTEQEATHRPVVFMFPGGGAQYVHMGAGLYASEPVFRATIDQCAELLRPLLGLDIRAIIFDTSARGTIDQAPTNDEGHDSSIVLRPSSEGTPALTQTGLALPALFAVEYAMAQLWMSWGVRPTAMIGHSLGEYSAACLAGVLSLEDALALVVLRGQLFEQLPSGAMLSLPLPEEAARELLTEELSIAAINGPSQCVISGPAEAIARLAASLTERAIEFRRIQIDVAAHSTLVTPILEPFTQFVARLRLHAPSIPYLSNVTGTWMTAGDATDPQYWGRHLRETVRFGDGIAELLRQPDQILLEVGPGQTLRMLAKLQLDDNRSDVVLTSLRHPYDRQPDLAFLLTTVGAFWQAGGTLDWAGFYRHERRHRIELPTYPFERQRYWIESAPRTDAPSPPAQTVKRPDIADWFYIPSWKRSLPARPATVQDLVAESRRWLVFIDAGGLGTQILEQLAQAGQVVVGVEQGASFARTSSGRYSLDPRRRDDYASLMAELGAANQLPDTILHLWSVTPEQQSTVAAFQQAQDAGFYSLLFLAQALDQQRIASPVQLWVVANNLQHVESSDRPAPEKATILGPCMVIPQEYAQIACHCIDIVPAPGARPTAQLAARLLGEIGAQAEPLIAYRGDQRWVQTFEPVRLEHDATPARSLRQRGVYLITGGLGGIGLHLADELARSVQARLILTGRTALPDRAAWDDWLAAHNDDDRISHVIRRVQALEAQGAEVLTVSADVASEADMRSVIALAEERFGALHGVIHAAGNVAQTAFKLIAETDHDACELHFQPKVYGVYTLAHVLQGRALDFCLLFSSNAAILGGLGFAGYAAANRFMDSFAAVQHGRDGSAWISANWDGWKTIDRERLSASFQTSLDQYAMQPDESVEAFRRIIAAATVAQVVVSTGDLASRLNRWIRQAEPMQLAQGDAGALHPRPTLANAYAAPNNEFERLIAEMWQDLLGIDQIGIHDNFFALGGHSLLATRVVARLRDIFQLELPLRSFFEAPTIAEVAQALVALQLAEADDETRALLEMVEQLSEEEAEAAFNRRSHAS